MPPPTAAGRAPATSVRAGAVDVEAVDPIADARERCGGFWSYPDARPPESQRRSTAEPGLGSVFAPPMPLIGGWWWRQEVGAPWVPATWSSCWKVSTWPAGGAVTVTGAP